MTKITTKRVLFILQLPPPVHGASLMNKHIIESDLLNRDLDMEMINLNFANSIKKLERFSLIKLFKAFYFGLTIISKIISHKPDLIYFTFSPRGYAFYRDILYVFLMKLFNQKIIFHLHGKGIKNSVKVNSFVKRLTRAAFKNTKVICMSKKLTEDVKSIYDDQPFIVPYGIEVQEGNGFSNSELNSGVPNILYLSNYIKTKGVLVLIDALKAVHEKGLKFKARLVGSPGDLSLEMLNEKIAQLNLEDCVEAVGPRYGKDKNVEFRNADIFVFPTFYENEAFPLVNLEAMQFGLPVISTDEGGIPDMFINKESGLIVESQNPIMLADKIAGLLEDEDLRKTMGINGYNRFQENFTLNHFERNILNTINQVLSRAKTELYPIDAV